MHESEDSYGRDRFGAICGIFEMNRKKGAAVPDVLVEPSFMNSKLIRTIFLALAFGFLVLWVLEFRRAGLFESYWLLLLCIICFLLFQFSRLKAAAAAKQAGQTHHAPTTGAAKPAKKPKK